MKVHIFDVKDSISIFGFLTTFKHACDMNEVHEREALQVFPHYVKENLANSLNSRMLAKHCLSSSISLYLPCAKKSQGPVKCCALTQRWSTDRWRNVRPTRRLLRITQRFCVTSNYPKLLLNNTSTLKSPNLARLPTNMTKKLSTMSLSKILMRPSGTAYEFNDHQTKNFIWWTSCLR